MAKVSFYKWVMVPSAFEMVNHFPKRECESFGDHALWKFGVVRI